VESTGTDLPRGATRSPRRRPARVTSYDVAKAAGVSQSAVSRAFDPKGSVDAEVRKKIHAAAHTLGWRPNSIASSLQRRRTDFIGLITAELSSPWRAQQLAALVPALESTGHRPLIFHTTRESEIDSLIDEVLGYQGRAIIVGAGLMSSRIAKICAREGLLVILLNRWVKAPGIVPISCDHKVGAHMAVDYLASRGCRRIAFLQGSLDSYAGQQRSEGFLERSRQLKISAEIIPLGAFDRESGRRAGKMIAARSVGKRPQGILAGNDAMALGLFDHAYATGAYSIPRDFALIGFDDIAEAAAPAYELTTIRQPLNELTTGVVALLKEWRAREPIRPRISGQLLKPTLVERRSALWNVTEAADV
jgi:DNA-binding LacI/PurR family transcriptional regulator